MREAVALRGDVSIAESVVEKIAAAAAREVPGIYPGGRRGFFATGAGEANMGIKARIRGHREVDLDMKMTVDYGEHIPTRGEQVRAAVARAVRAMTDLEAREIKVKVTEILTPENHSVQVDAQTIKDLRR